MQNQITLVDEANALGQLIDDQLNEQVNDIMNRFNFARVLTVMHAINWTWRGKVVEVNELKSTAIYLMDQVSRAYFDNGNVWASVSTGGFVARIENQKGVPRMSLTFSVETVDAYV